MNEDDRQLRRRVSAEPEWEPSVDAAHIGVAAKGGVVTLTGHAASYAEKVAVEQAARRVRGVKAIAQEMEVRFPSEKRTSDDEIAERALRILDWDAAVPKGAVSTKVERGWVTLSGEVDWHYQRAAAEHDVQKLGGVLGVLNPVRVKAKAQLEALAKPVDRAQPAKRFTRAIPVAVVDPQGELVAHIKRSGFRLPPASPAPAYQADEECKPAPRVGPQVDPEAAASDLPQPWSATTPSGQEAPPRRGSRQAASGDPLAVTDQ